MGVTALIALGALGAFASGIAVVLLAFVFVACIYFSLHMIQKIFDSV